MTTAEILDLAGVTREELGRALRLMWIADARRRPGEPKPSHVAPWEDMPTADQEVDMAMAAELFAAGWRARSDAETVRPCHCLCAVSHPQIEGICDALNATVERTAQTRTLALAVRLCRPCADAATRWQADKARQVGAGGTPT